jgi:hypothetical protein
MPNPQHQYWLGSVCAVFVAESRKLQNGPLGNEQPTSPELIEQRLPSLAPRSFLTVRVFESPRGR